MLYEEDLIAALSERFPDWREHYDDPFEAADALGLDTDDGEEAYPELRFDD